MLILWSGDLVNAKLTLICIILTITCKYAQLLYHQKSFAEMVSYHLANDTLSKLTPSQSHLLLFVKTRWALKILKNMHDRATRKYLGNAHLSYEFSNKCQRYPEDSQSLQQTKLRVNRDDKWTPSDPVAHGFPPYLQLSIGMCRSYN